MKYPVNEIFYSIQGEGYHTGRAAYFIRLAGCNLNCDFCDTDHTSHKELMTVEEIVQFKWQDALVILTGGEPSIHNLLPLVNELGSKGFLIHIETNGTELLQADFDWVTVSPKNMNCVNKTVRDADEIKFLCGTPCWEDFISEFMSRYRLSPQDHRQYHLMPLSQNVEFTELAVEYVKRNPWMRLCIQTHKYIGVK